MFLLIKSMESDLNIQPRDHDSGAYEIVLLFGLIIPSKDKKRTALWKLIFDCYHCYTFYAQYYRICG